MADCSFSLSPSLYSHSVSAVATQVYTLKLGYTIALLGIKCGTCS